MKRVISPRSASVAAAGVLAITLVWAGNGSFGGTPTASDPKLLEEAQESLQRFDEPAEAQEFHALQRSPDVVWQRGAETQVEPIDAQAYVEADADLGAAGPARGVPAPPANDYATPWTQLGPGNIGGRTRGS